MLTRRSRLAPGALAALTLTALALPSTAGPGMTVQPSVQLLLDRGTDLPFTPALAAVSCPVERGPVKESSDADRYRVSTTLTTTSIAALRAQAKPTSYPRNNRIAPTERRTLELRGVYLTQYKIESDGDIHAVIKDSAGRAMIAELPYGACVPTSSRWKRVIAATRATFTRRFPVSSSWHYTHQLVDLHGLGMFDPPHGQTGAAPNGIELHPVTYLLVR